MHIFFGILLAAVLWAAPLKAGALENIPGHNLTVRFDLERGKLEGTSEISLPAGKAYSLDLSGLRVMTASVNGMKILIDPGMTTLTFQPSSADSLVKIGYEAEFGSLPADDSGRNQGVLRGNCISGTGVTLTRGWYPALDGFAVFHLKAVLPGGYEGISEAEEITVSENPGGSREFSFSFPHPIGSISFIAGRYGVEKTSFNGTDIYAFFMPEDKGLSESYLGHAEKYIDMYEKLLGKFPFKRFSIVESPAPMGHSLPTITLLGRDVVRLPFIVETSLGHEILHQWFGNMVYVDYRGGNWSEGLTTYLADHRFEELKGKGSDYRKQLLVSFQSHVTAENDFPLSSFVSRQDRVTGALGYGKAAMVFHMLRELTGDDVFFNSLRTFIEKNRFRAASWNDIRETFEQVSAEKLDWFFRQWVEEKGVPELELKNAEVKYRGSKAVVSFDVVQKGGNFRMTLPVSLKSREGETRKTFEIEKASTGLEMVTEGTPVELIIDDEYDLLRRLSGEEFPPVISRLLGDSEKIFVLPQDREKEYAALSDFMKKEGFTEKREGEIRYDDLKRSSLIIPGPETRLAERLFGRTGKTQDDLYLVVKENPFNKSGVIGLLDGASLPVMEEYIHKMTHYGKYSRIAFRGGENTLKTIDDSRRGLGETIRVEVPGVEIPRIVDLRDVIEKVAGKDIVYVGEGHDKFEHHRVQLEIIMGLHKKNGKIAIGMEMFQRPFQKVLDDYINGLIEEKEFLKKSEYYKRWVFDYNLYREILLYAREFRIPVIALNARKETVSKVFSAGLYSLTPEEMEEVPGDMDLSDSDYSARLREAFERHRNHERRNFDFFLQSQVLWDETMAHSIDEFMQKNPGHQIIVLAGVGHLTFGSGIPGRVFRINKKPYSIVLNYDEVEKGIADFLLFPSPLKADETPKLMVMLKEERGRVQITGFSPDSVAEKGGLRKDDIIVSLEDTKVEGVDDMKIFLLDRKKGDTIAVKVLRKKFLSGLVEMNFKVTL